MDTEAKLKRIQEKRKLQGASGSDNEASRAEEERIMNELKSLKVRVSDGLLRPGCKCCFLRFRYE